MPRPSLGRRRGRHTPPGRFTLRSFRRGDADITLGSGGTSSPLFSKPSPRRWLLPLLVLAGVLTATAAIVSAREYARTARAAPAPVARATTRTVEATVAPPPTAPATPLFARYRSLRLHLPVSPGSVTAVAFHQASYDDALPMTSMARVIDATAAAHVARWKRHHPTGVTEAGAVAASSSVGTSAPAATPSGRVWKGSAFRLWRSGRHGSPDTAADVGAAPWTPVYAPVDGRVLAVRSYKLYNKYPDYEIHIQPTASTKTDVVLIHITGIRIHQGDTVVGGVTRVASVRRLSKYFEVQLSEYATDKGDHVHVQVNKLIDKFRLWNAGSTETPNEPPARLPLR